MSEQQPPRPHQGPHGPGEHQPGQDHDPRGAGANEHLPDNAWDDLARRYPADSPTGAESADSPTEDDALFDHDLQPEDSNDNPGGAESADTPVEPDDTPETPQKRQRGRVGSFIARTISKVLGSKGEGASEDDNTRPSDGPSKYQRFKDWATTSPHDRRDYDKKPLTDKEIARNERREAKADFRQESRAEYAQAQTGRAAAKERKAEINAELPELQKTKASFEGYSIPEDYGDKWGIPEDSTLRGRSVSDLATIVKAADLLEQKYPDLSGEDGKQKLVALLAGELEGFNTQELEDFMGLAERDDAVDDLEKLLNKYEAVSDEITQREHELEMLEENYPTKQSLRARIKSAVDRGITHAYMYKYDVQSGEYQTHKGRVWGAAAVGVVALASLIFFKGSAEDVQDTAQQAAEQSGTGGLPIDTETSTTTAPVTETTTAPVETTTAAPTTTTEVDPTTTTTAPETTTEVTTTTSPETTTETITTTSPGETTTTQPPETTETGDNEGPADDETEEGDETTNPDTKPEDKDNILEIKFSPEASQLSDGGNIWESSEQYWKDRGVEGTPAEMTQLTDALKDWRLEEMGISEAGARNLAVGTKLPMPNPEQLADIIKKSGVDF